MTNLVNHPGFWMQADAAASLARFEAKYGVIEISSAGRTEAEQQALINRYDKGGAANRPPYLYDPARPASASRHVFDGGIALDTNNQTIMHEHGQEYGWYFNFAYDVVHFEYEIAHDQHRGAAASTPAHPSTAAGYSIDTKNRQSFLNQYRGEHLTIDGLQGASTTAAIERYQTFLKEHYGYTGKIDGDWGAATTAAHNKYNTELHKPAPATPGKAGLSSTKDIQVWLNQAIGAKLKTDGIDGPATKSAIKRYQIFLRAYGYTGVVDGVWGAGTQAAHNKFFAASK
jgi:peptidoglycan hydrolase-like protein with peptidoglycan-binding domain